jgi:hypothetical protein
MFPDLSGSGDGGKASDSMDFFAYIVFSWCVRAAIFVLLYALYPERTRCKVAKRADLELRIQKLSC